MIFAKVVVVLMPDRISRPLWKRKKTISYRISQAGEEKKEQVIYKVGARREKPFYFLPPPSPPPNEKFIRHCKILYWLSSLFDYALASTSPGLNPDIYLLDLFRSCQKAIITEYMAKWCRKSSQNETNLKRCFWIWRYRSSVGE